VSDDKLVISTNDFASLTGGLLGAQYWVLNKNDMSKESQRWELHLWTLCRSHLSPSSSISQLDKYRIHGQHRLLLDIPELCRLFNITGNPGVSKVTVSSGLNLTISLIGTFPMVLAAASVPHVGLKAQYSPRSRAR